MAGYTHWLVAITTDIEKANRIGGVIGPSSADDSMFTVGIPCYAPGTTFTPVPDGPITRHEASAAPVAMSVSLAVRGAIAPFIEQFRDGLYPAPLLAAGMTEAEIDAARGAMTVVVGLRTELEPAWRAAIAAAGYVLEPLNG